ncbi:tol-pal system protein YbgF [Mesorhizobium erdmanii]|uniref:Cell division coordinator CpoB n=1 Tax=Mesorhizobium erdmanii TaxID=1777866 RepID=A0A6M7UDC1_9HYPH|nr:MULTISPECIES: tol-pal system protein YbgF [Mesorhizobium]OBQ63678.1 tol-pal system protein YbgF [Mesorhizobium loti]QKC75244.1 tol-pal system protein YbgF [Mesorhizobium erdmanii]
MHLRSVLSGTLAALLLSGFTALASGSGAGGTGQSTDSGSSFHLPSIELPGIFGDKKKPNQVQMVQSDATAVTSLEDQLRQMNGKIEELNFQVLQMQEQIRKQQEDNEFRFQQLEGGSQGGSQGGQAPAAPKKKSDATTDTNTNVAAAPATQAPADAGAAVGSDQSSGGKTVEDVIVESPDGDPGKVIPGRGAPEKTFGSITVDKNGNVIDAGGSTQSTAPVQDTAPATGAPAKAGKSNGTIVAALPSTKDPEELYRNSYQFILSGDYGTAEQGFRDHIARFPRDAKTADAHYWLGESLLGQQKYRDAAEVFLAASKDYPKAKKAPDMLLKLGVSLVGLKQHDVACATFSEVGKRYPDISNALKERVKQEKALAAC